MADFISDAPRRLLDAYAEGTRKGYGSSPVYPEWHGQGDNSRDYLGASRAGDCRRKLWFALAPEFESEALTDEQVCLFSDGYLLEADTRTRLQIGGLSVGGSQEEYSHPDEPRIKGHIDGIVGEIGGRWYVFEHKAMRLYPWKNFYLNRMEDTHSAGYIVRPGTVQDTNPQYWDQVQVLLTMRRMHVVKYDGLDLGEQRCLFVVRSKESGMLAVEEIPSDYELGEALIERMRLVLADYDAGRVSPKDYDPQDSRVWQCNYCEYRRHCLSIGNTERLSLPDDDQNPDGSAPCPVLGCKGMMSPNRRGGTVVLVCARCEHEEAL